MHCPAPPMPRCSARRRATASGWPTPSCSSRSSATSPPMARKSNSAAARSSATAWASRRRPRAEGAVDTVITNALIVDHSGIYKADVGLRDGRIARIGKAGNPDTQPGVDIVIGPGTEAIAGEGRILTAGGIDSHIHFICPQQVEDALHSGHHDDARRRHRAGARHARHHLHAGALAHRPHAAGARRLSGELRPLGQGQRVAAGGAGGNGRRRGLCV